MVVWVDEDGGKGMEFIERVIFQWCEFFHWVNVCVSVCVRFLIIVTFANNSNSFLYMFALLFSCMCVYDFFYNFADKIVTIGKWTEVDLFVCSIFSLSCWCCRYFAAAVAAAAKTRSHVSLLNEKYHFRLIHPLLKAIFLLNFSNI